MPPVLRVFFKDGRAENFFGDHLKTSPLDPAIIQVIDTTTNNQVVMESPEENIEYAIPGS